MRRLWGGGYEDPLGKYKASGLLGSTIPVSCVRTTMVWDYMRIHFEGARLSSGAANFGL